MPEFSFAKPTTISPYWTTTDEETVKLYLGDVRDVLSRLPTRSVHCVVTSPPYWGLRDYGVAGQVGSEPSPDCGTHGKAQCGKCFVCTMVAVFRELRRVLRDDGTCWLNLGDTYSGGGGGNYGTGKNGKYTDGNAYATNFTKGCGVPSGNLIGVPWRVALALQADGWILRQDIVWHKPAPMPESVRNRCTKAHEYVFLLTKRKDYYYDANAIKEKGTTVEVTEEEYTTAKAKAARVSSWYAGKGDRLPDGVESGIKSANGFSGTPPGGRNKRSVWTVASQGYPGAHFATFPPKLIEPMILAGTSEKGCCPHCQSPWRRVTERINAVRTHRESKQERDRSFRHSRNGIDSTLDSSIAEIKTVGWEPTCHCQDVDEDDLIPCTVLDPFVGSGTTCVVAVQHEINSIGIDLSQKYLDNNAVQRITGELLSRPVTSHLVPHNIKRPKLGKPVSNKPFGS